MSEGINIAEAYDKGRALFMGIELLVAPGALVPRPETELNCLVLGARFLASVKRVRATSDRHVLRCWQSGMRHLAQFPRHPQFASRRSS